MFGKKVSHSHKKTNKKQSVNLQRITANIGGGLKKINVCTSCLKANKVVKA
jgi:large subunit ribosomal protein L28